MSVVNARKRTRIYKRDAYRCVKCGNEENPTIDHIWPRAHGGSNLDHNLQTLCRPCNLVKASTLPRGAIHPSQHLRDCHPVWGCVYGCRLIAAAL